ncbi:uncharacterized protein MONBRDRAFT_39113 [Monosiga brevicollis MX1]|uniref:Biogenesis of lysosome-related organelles complex 1 subunit 7 n=1 Tax=Monosiga brevicollis TaxID=81824 RepID=A9VC98_MONBE|nr:uncharacterized protein MONBRDRAFT_39113 [Monosiga brevicollis MX1]EDQ84862.1 predicted protein [Monosiga brevicollis MX1]|eukprot:XP_001750363.1 hypothetical protein [Monosiga brevicollis MX1]
MAAPDSPHSPVDAVESERQLSNLLSDSILQLLAPLLKSMDDSVRDTQQSQRQLAAQLDQLQTELARYEDIQSAVPDLNVYAQKLGTTKVNLAKLNGLVSTIEQRVERMNKLANKAEASLVVRRDTALQQQQQVEAQLPDMAKRALAQVPEAAAISAYSAEPIDANAATNANQDSTSSQPTSAGPATEPAQGEAQETQPKAASATEAAAAPEEGAEKSEEPQEPEEPKEPEDGKAESTDEHN